MQEASDEVHNGLILGRVPGASTQEKFAIANHALHSLAVIEDLKITQEKLWNILNKKLFENFIFQSTREVKCLKSSLQGEMPLQKSLWMAKTKAIMHCTDVFYAQ